MYIAMNRFTVDNGKEAEFEETWRNRDSHLLQVPGFKTFHLLKGASDDQATAYISHSQWESENAFLDWTKSEAFRLAHSSARMPQGVLLGPPRFEGYQTVSTIEPDV